MMKNKDIGRCASTLEHLVKVDCPLDEALMALADLVPKHRYELEEISRGVAAGQSLATLLREARLWPEPLIRAVDAGEASGALGEALKGIVEIVTQGKKLSKAIIGQLMMPGIYLMGGLVVFTVYVGFVFPSATVAIQNKDRVGLIAFVDAMHNGLTDYWYLFAALFAGVVYGVYSVATKETYRNTLMRFADGLPLIGKGLMEVFCSVWTQYMALLDRAGDIPYEEMLEISTSVIPEPYRDGFNALNRDIENRSSLMDATDLKSKSPSDPRQAWPVILKISLANSARTGDTASLLQEAVEPLAEEGMEKVARFMMVINAIALAIVGMMIFMPMVMLALVQMTMIQSVG